MLGNTPLVTQFRTIYLIAEDKDTKVNNLYTNVSCNGKAARAIEIRREPFEWEVPGLGLLLRSLDRVNSPIKLILSYGPKIHLAFSR